MSVLALVAVGVAAEEVSSGDLPRDPAWVVVLSSEAALRVLPVGDVTEELLDGAEAAWVGASGHPPVRRSPPLPAPERLFDPEERDSAVPLKVPVVVPDAEARRRRGELGRVIAAPVAMWQEVPEGLLPSRPVPQEGVLEVPRLPGEDWRLRHVAPGGGSWWTGAPAGRGRVRLHAWDADGVGTTVHGADGGPLPEVALTVLESSERSRSPRFLARFSGDDSGTVTIPSLPDAEPASFLIGAPGHTPRTWSGVPSALPGTWSLDRGRALSGRVVDGDGEPLQAVDVSVEAWLEEDVEILFSKVTRTGEDGAWSLEELPRRKMLFTARKDGFAPYRERLDPALEQDQGKAAQGLERIVLHRGAALEVEVVDGRGVPVPGVRVSGRGLGPRTTEEDGRVTMTGLPPAGRTFLEFEAEGFLPSRIALRPPHPEERRIVLERAFQVTGRYLDPDGVPVGAGTAVVEGQGCPERRFELQPDGSFEATVEPEVQLRLALLAPSTRRLEAAVEPGAPGETRDLGDFHAPPGLQVAGWVSSGVDGLPVAGARVWAPRPSKGGPALAWMHADLLEARSDEDGAFVLSGLPPGATVLRAEAPGHARAHRHISPAEGELEVDVGELILSPGGSVRVLLSSESEAEPAVAVLDLLEGGNPADQLTARVEDGVGEIGPVPAGTAGLEVRRGPQVLCRKQVAIEEGETREVECGSRPLVTGRVWAGERPAEGGTLEWSTGGGGDMPAGISSRSSPGGLRRQQTFGPRPGGVSVELGSDGSFVTRELVPGEWSVTWVPAGGARSEPREVEIPEAERYSVTLEYAETTLSGRVVDADGSGVHRASVRELASGALAFTDATGAFRITLSPGGHRLQASWRDLTSPVVDLEVEAGRRPDPVELRVEEAAPGLLVVGSTEGGRPAAGGFVFVETDAGGRLLVTADVAGRAEVDLPTPRPGAVRVALHHEGGWSLTDWQQLSEGPQELEVEIDEVGTLKLVVADGGGLVQIEAPGGWDLTHMLSMLGRRPLADPARPLVLTGLPPGRYGVAVGGAVETLTLSPGRTERVEIE